MALCSEVYDAALNTILRQCLNVSSYSSVPSIMKEGAVHTHSYTETTNIGGVNIGGGHWHKREISAVVEVNWNIKNPVYQISSSTVSSAFATHMQKYGFSQSETKEISARRLLKFYSALIAFCQARVKIACSPYTTTKCIVYETSGTIPSISGFEEDTSIAVAADINTITTQMITLMANNIKTYKIQYTENSRIILPEVVTTSG